MEVYRLLQLFVPRQSLRITRLAESGEWLLAMYKLRLGASDINERMFDFCGLMPLHSRPARRIDYVDARYTSGIAK